MLVIDEDGFIVLVNIRARQLFGYDGEELIGTPVELLVSIADPKFRPYATGLQMVGRRRDGSEFLTEISVSTMTTATGLLISAAVAFVAEELTSAAAAPTGMQWEEPLKEALMTRLRTICSIWPGSSPRCRSRSFPR
jgi:PAS domain S-box-containing protein